MLKYLGSAEAVAGTNFESNGANKRVEVFCASAKLLTPPPGSLVTCVWRTDLISADEYGRCIVGVASDEGVGSCPTRGSRCATRWFR